MSPLSFLLGGGERGYIILMPGQKNKNKKCSPCADNMSNDVDPLAVAADDANGRVTLVLGAPDSRAP